MASPYRCTLSIGSFPPAAGSHGCLARGDVTHQAPWHSLETPYPPLISPNGLPLSVHSLNRLLSPRCGQSRLPCAWRCNAPSAMAQSRDALSAAYLSQWPPPIGALSQSAPFPPLRAVTVALRVAM